MPASSCGNDVTANGLFTDMTTGVDFSIPAVDLTLPKYSAPDAAGNPLFGDITRLSETDLTQRVVNGSGMFDGLMATIKAHLKEEYDKQRLTGKEYAATYAQLTQTALSAAVQYLTQRDQAFYSAQLVQKQAQLAEIEAVRGRVNLEAEKARLQRERMDANTSAANYALAKLRLATEDASTCHVKAQTAQTEYQTGNLLPAQLGQLQKQTEVADYELVNILPKEALRIQSQVDTAAADISRITAQKDQTLYETSALLPAQRLNVEADTNVKNYQLTAMLPAQTLGIEKDTEMKNYQLTQLLPSQKANVDEQMEANRAKTMDTRSDGVTSVVGSIGKQKDLHQQQITSYQHDSMNKVVKMLTDTWITQKSLDEGLTPPTSFDDTSINSAYTALRTSVGL